MRTAVLGVPFFANVDTVLHNTDTVCQVTHADPRCRASCAAVTSAVAQLLQGKSDVEEVIKAALVHAAKLTEDPAELLRYGNALSLEEMKLGDRASIGYAHGSLVAHIILIRYTYKCFGSGFWALRQRDFAAALVDITREAGGMYPPPHSPALSCIYE